MADLTALATRFAEATGRKYADRQTQKGGTLRVDQNNLRRPERSAGALLQGLGDFGVGVWGITANGAHNGLGTFKVLSGNLDTQACE